VFTNTRSQSELWYQNLIEARPDWAGVVALHHGSLDREVREWVENGLKRGELKAVVCTASLDLGVDFLPVERVLQIGSAKGIARLLQRAGRSGHAPGRVSRVTLVPTNSLELLEAAGAKRAVATRRIEARQVPNKPFDVLVQHLVTIALGGGFRRGTVRGSEERLVLPRTDARGMAVGAGFRRARRPEPDRLSRIPARAAGRGGRVPRARRHHRPAPPHEHRHHRVGCADAGAVHERRPHRQRRGILHRRLKPGDRFLFGGRILELVRVHEMTAFVKRGIEQGRVSRWSGTKVPLSAELAHAARES
jgi:ATP-dependent Lhr-like helicase